MSALRRCFLVLPVLLLAACQDDITPVSRLQQGPDYLFIADAQPGFSFLPPMVKYPGSFTGTFDPGRHPRVRIVCTGAAGPSCPELAVLEFGTGPGAVKLDLEGESYHALWHSPATLTLGAGMYQLVIEDEGGQLALADLTVFGSQRDARNASGALPIVRGHPFQIRFRIEIGTSAGSIQVAPSAVILVPGEHFTFVATEMTGLGGEIVGSALVWSSSAPDIATVGPDGTVQALTVGNTDITVSNGRLAGMASVTVVTLPPAASANIGKAGGSLSSPLADGSLLDVLVPPDAVRSATPFVVEPTQRAPKANASFLFTPSGLLFGAPVTFAYTPAPGAPPGEPLYLYWAKGILRLLPDGLTGRLAGSTRLIGELPPTTPALAARTSLFRLLANAQAPGQPASIGPLSTAEIIAAGRAALNDLIRDPTLGSAAALMEVMYRVSEERFEPDFDPAGSLLVTDWRTVVCARLQDQTTHYLGLSVDAPFDFPDYFSETELLMAWAGPAEQTRDPVMGFLPAGCSGGMPNYVGAIENRAGAFLPNIPALVNPPGRDLLVRFDEMIDFHLARLVTLDGLLQFAGVTAFRPTLRQIGNGMLDQLRLTAWTACRDRSDQSRISRLMDLEASGGEELSTYEQGDLADDLVGCMTQLEWRTRPHAAAGNGPAESSGTFGGTGVGQLVTTASFTLREDRDLIIAGRAQIMMCPGNVQLGIDPQENQEHLAITARTPAKEIVMDTRTPQLGGQRVYLHQDSIIITPADLSAALDMHDDTPIELSISRLGNTCPGVFNIMGPEAILGTIAPMPIGRTKVTLDPTSKDIAPGETASFEATVENSDNGVTWEVTGGTFTTQGNTLTYTAGDTPGSFSVIAKSVDLPDRSTTAAVTIVDECVAPSSAMRLASRAALRVAGQGNVCATVDIAPSSTVVASQGKVQFVVNMPVTWSASAGSITSGGLYTAPFSGTSTITARSIEDPSVTGTATVRVVFNTGLTVTPVLIGVTPGNSVQYQSNGPAPFLWSTDSPNSITSTGLFTAGSVMGEYVVMATSSAGGVGLAKVIVDPIAAVYSAIIKQVIPLQRTFTQNVGVNRFVNPRFECGFVSIGCYGLGNFDLGPLNFAQCFFIVSLNNLTALAGSCEGPPSSGAIGTFRGEYGGNTLSFTVTRTFQGAIIEQWVVTMVKIP